MSSLAQCHARHGSLHRTGNRNVARRQTHICASHKSNRSSAQPNEPALSRRTLLAVPPALLSLSAARRATAFTPPPPGFRAHQDKLDGYSFLYPSDWLPVTTSGNDVFFRNPFTAEENVFVDVSSPSSSRYESVADLGTPEEAAKRILDQFLEEFMSTRIGIKKNTEVVSASARTGDDGRLYYDILTRVQSIASRNQLAVTQAEIDEGMVTEWDREFLTVLGVANKRLYSFRLQASTAAFEADAERYRKIAQSFTCKEVAV